MKQDSAPSLLCRARARARLAVMLVLGGLLVVISATIVWYVGRCMSDRSSVRRLEAEIRKKGEPLTLAELAATYPPIPDEQNAALPLVELWEKENPALWAAFRAGQEPLPERVEPTYDPETPFLGKNQRDPKPGQKLSPVSQQAAAACLQAQAGHLDAVRAALGRPRSRFPIELEDGIHAQLPHLRELSTEGQFFRLAALLAADRGDRNGALSALQDLVRLSDTLADEPTQSSQLKRVAFLNMALSGAEDLLARQTLSAEELLRLDRLVKSFQPRQMLRRALVGERATALNIFNWPEDRVSRFMQSDLPDQDSRLTAAEYRFSKNVLSAIELITGDRRLMLETFGQQIQLAEDKSPDAFRRAKQLGEDVEKQIHGFLPKFSSGMVLHRAEQRMGRCLALEARQRAALVAMALERYRLRHAGALPDQINVLVPAFLTEIPRDPFNGDPLCYRRTPTGYVVYSVGTNLRDDGGDRQTRSGSGERLDEVFAVERADSGQ